MSWLSGKSDEGAIAPALQYDKLSESSTFCNKFPKFMEEADLNWVF